MSSSQVRDVFTKFLTEFYVEIEQTKIALVKIGIIAKLNKRLELLHPVKDGSGRTNTLFINKILTEYGFNPVLLEFPYRSTTYGQAQWIKYFMEGIEAWKAQRTFQKSWAYQQ
jgi:Fic family protein